MAPELVNVSGRSTHFYLYIQRFRVEKNERNLELTRTLRSSPLAIPFIILPPENPPSFPPRWPTNFKSRRGDWLLTLARTGGTQPLVPSHPAFKPTLIFSVVRPVTFPPSTGQKRPLGNCGISCCVKRDKNCIDLLPTDFTMALLTNNLTIVSIIRFDVGRLFKRKVLLF